MLMASSNSTRQAAPVAPYKENKDQLFEDEKFVSELLVYLAPLILTPFSQISRYQNLRRTLAMRLLQLPAIAYALGMEEDRGLRTMIEVVAEPAEG